MNRFDFAWLSGILSPCCVALTLLVQPGCGSDASPTASREDAGSDADAGNGQSGGQNRPDASHDDSCATGDDCAKGSYCAFEPGCGNKTGRCASLDMCSSLPVATEYCDCNGVTKTGGGCAPSEPFSARSACPTKP